jgi:hypothetical protein
MEISGVFLTPAPVVQKKRSIDRVINFWLEVGGVVRREKERLAMF